MHTASECDSGYSEATGEIVADGKDKTCTAHRPSSYDVWGFYVAYVAHAIDDDDSSLFDTTSNIEACLMDLAACKIQVDEKFAPKFRTFRYRGMKDYQKWLTTVKDAAFRTGTPLRAELLDMVSDTQWGTWAHGRSRVVRV